MTISVALKEEAWSEASNLPLVLITIDHADLALPIRVVNNRTDVVSNGETFIAFPFEVSLPDDMDDTAPTARIRISNVSQEIAEAIRTISTAAEVTVQVVRHDTPDTVELEWPTMSLRNVKWDSLSVSGDLVFEDLIREPFPAHMFSPANFPGLVP